MGLSVERLHPTSVKALLFIVQYHAHYGRGPDYPALVEFLGVVKSVVHHHLAQLRKAGLVDWEDGRRGTLHPTVRRVR